MKSFKKIVSKLPANVRTGFLESMAFANGKLVNIKTNRVGGKLNGDELIALMRNCGCTTIGFTCDAFTAGSCHKDANSACDAAACKGSKGATVVSLATLLQGVPPGPRHQFLGSLDFKDAQLTSADTPALEGYISPKRMKQLPGIRRRKTASRR